MTRTEILEKYEIIDYRIPKKGDLVLACDNNCNYSVRKVSSNLKYLYANILKKK